MNFKNFFDTAKNLPINVSVLLRGDHGIGKSQSIYQLGAHFGLDVVERRLSQMSEGDMIGLPKVEGGVTKFLPPDWYMDACSRPVILFLDELNRATPEVLQAAFQVVLDRVLNGNELHPGTRVYSAVNTNAQYTVTEMDPALIDRFWVADLDPTPADFFAWADGKIHASMLDFLKLNPKRLEPSPAVDVGVKQPSRRTWEKLDKAMRACNFYDLDVKTNSGEESAIYNLATGFLGVDVARDFKNYIKTVEQPFTAADVLDSWAKNKKRITTASQEKWNFLIDKLVEEIKTVELSPAQSKNLGNFMESIPHELRLHFWGGITAENNDMMIKNVNVIATDVVPHIVAAAQTKIDNSDVK